jgi:hypothetical protein
MKASGASAHIHLSPLTLLAALSALVTLALVGGLIFVFMSRSTQGGPPSTLAGGAYITTAQTASGIHQDGSPVDSLTSFNVGQTVYIAYTVTDAGPGTVTIKLYANGVFVDSLNHQFQQRSSYNAYFSFQATKAGDWEADLYWQQRGASGDGALEQRVTFLVGDASTLAASPFVARLCPIISCIAGVARS